jgi:hypothetical protein
MVRNNERREIGKTECKCKGYHKILGLKGLALIYKILSVLVVLFVLFQLAMLWYQTFRQGLPKSETLFVSANIIISYGFYALVLFTVARVLKTLRKIKHAVEYK